MLPSMENQCQILNGLTTLSPSLQMIKAPAKQLDLFLDFSLDFSLVIQKQFASVSWKFEEKQS